MAGWSYGEFCLFCLNFDIARRSVLVANTSSSTGGVGLFKLHASCYIEEQGSNTATQARGRHTVRRAAPCSNAKCAMASTASWLPALNRQLRSPAHADKLYHCLDSGCRVWVRVRDRVRLCNVRVRRFMKGLESVVEESLANEDAVGVLSSCEKGG